MKKQWSILVAGLLAVSAQAELFTVDTAHAGINFAIKHMMISNTKGAFNAFEGVVDYDIASKTLVSIKGSIDTASIDTNSEKRDGHLRNADFFNVELHPKITFVSSSVQKTGENSFAVTGTMNFLGSDHELTLPVTVHGPVDGRQGGKLIGLESHTTLNRRDLGMTYGKPAMIGDEVKVSIEAEALAE